MPTITVYVDQELHDQVRAAKLPASTICQRALRRTLRTQARQRDAAKVNALAAKAQAIIAANRNDAPSN